MFHLSDFEFFDVYSQINKLSCRKNLKINMEVDVSIYAELFLDKKSPSIFDIVLFFGSPVFASILKLSN